MSLGFVRWRSRSSTKPIKPTTSLIVTDALAVLDDNRSIKPVPIRSPVPKLLSVCSRTDRQTAAKSDGWKERGEQSRPSESESTLQRSDADQYRTTAQRSLVVASDWDVQAPHPSPNKTCILFTNSNTETPLTDPSYKQTTAELHGQTRFLCDDGARSIAAHQTHFSGPLLSPPDMEKMVQHLI